MSRGRRASGASQLALVAPSSPCPGEGALGDPSPPAAGLVHRQRAGGGSTFYGRHSPSRKEPGRPQLASLRAPNQAHGQRPVLPHPKPSGPHGAVLWVPFIP